MDWLHYHAIYLASVVPDMIAISLKLTGMPQLQDITAYTNEYLRIDDFADYCPNGLQVEGQAVVDKVASGVTASLAFIEQAIEWGAQCLLVHHGYFWKHERAEVVGMKKRRLQALLSRDVGLLAYHLPLDAHPVVGNNIQLAHRLEITSVEPLQKSVKAPIGNIGMLAAPIAAAEFVVRCEQVLARKAVHIDSGPAQVHKIAWCTGGAQSMIEQAVEQNVDVYLTGEISEQTVHTARECGLHFIAAGHHATERYGVQALGGHLAEKFRLEHRFFDIENPA